VNIDTSVCEVWLWTFRHFFVSKLKFSWPVNCCPIFQSSFGGYAQSYVFWHTWKNFWNAALDFACGECIPLTEVLYLGTQNLTRSQVWGTGRMFHQKSLFLFMKLPHWHSSVSRCVVFTCTIWETLSLAVPESSSVILIVLLPSVQTSCCTSQYFHWLPLLLEDWSLLRSSLPSENVRAI
jgi:hypothetical protein